MFFNLDEFIKKLVYSMNYTHFMALIDEKTFIRRDGKYPVSTTSLEYFENNKWRKLYLINPVSSRNRVYLKQLILVLPSIHHGHT